MEQSLFAISVELMVVGMGTTFAFLIILVGVMKILEIVVNIINKYLPEVAAAQQSSAPKSQGLNKAKIALAIAAAKNFKK
ncbi:MAG: OadG family protein [Elusimicrobiota bacterium]|jgi:sodium pump decarboxylase gamma subunit|nr:OadG family protein [Elusimicrobiota bacterium]